MELVVVAVAVTFGFAAAQVRLPPFVGYLAAGFALGAFGFESTPVIEEIADVGVLLLLFGIGLKLRLRSLAQPTVWGTAVIAALVTVAVVGGLLMAVGGTGLPLVGGMGAGQALLVGFALSFSSTVFAVKTLEEQGEQTSLAGRTAIGILIVQDLFAVAFLTASEGTLPSVWAVALLAGLVVLRPLAGWLLDRAGHGELQLLLGFTLAVVVGGGGFALVGLKPDLGALVVGALLASHPRAKELADRLLGLKDLLLVGFFLSIGLGGTPTPSALGVAILAVALIPLKSVVFLATLTRLRLRVRTSLHTSLTLSNYSEFGLIVAAVGVEQGWLAADWLAALAVTVSLSFALAAPLSALRYRIYERLRGRLARFERRPLRSEDALIEPEAAEVLVFGMGRVGTGAYDEMVERRGRVVLGVERLGDRVEAHTQAGRRVLRGDATDLDFWERIRLGSPHPNLVLLAMSDHQANLEAVQRVRAFVPEAMIAAAARWPDEVAELEDAGVHVARDLFGEAGQGLADDALSLSPRTPTGEPQRRR
ncbi:MAG: cation:proton antiporter [Actinobacteria bacterium]|nr:cation:proton antiporter [Actinomycetota bacterium]